MDSEKVIKGLYACTTLGEDGVTDGDCKICPYDKGYATGECWVQMNRDALALIKEQQEYIEYWSAKYDEYGKAYMKVRDERDALLKEQENASKRNPVIVCPHCGKRVK